MSRNEEQTARSGPGTGNRLQVIFETAEPGAGVPLDDLRLVLGHLSEAVRLLARDLRREDRPGAGEGRRSAYAAEDPCPLRVTGISGGSVVLDLAIAPTDDGAGSEAPGSDDEPGRRVVRAILGGGADEPGTAPRTTLPPPVADHLAAIGESRSPAVPRVRLRDPDSDLERNLPREGPATPELRASEPAVARGRLRSVNPTARTAELHRYGEWPVRVRFPERLDEAVLELQVQWVEVAGTRSRCPDSEREVLTVDRIGPCDAEPFDPAEFLATPPRNPTGFDPYDLRKIDLTPEEAEAFDRALRRRKS